MTNVEMVNEVKREMKHAIDVLNIKLDYVEKQVKAEEELKKEEKKVLSERMINFKKDDDKNLNRKYYQKGFESFKKYIYELLKTRVSTTEKLIAKKEKEVENLEKLKVKLKELNGYVSQIELFENIK